MRLTQTFQDPLLNLFMPHLTIMPPIFHMIQIFNGHFVLFAHFLKHVSFGLKAKTPRKKMTSLRYDGKGTNLQSLSDVHAKCHNYSEQPQFRT